MTKAEYIKAVLKNTGLDRKTQKRIEADLATDIDARLEAGAGMAQVMEEMGAPAQVAQSLLAELGGGPRKSRWRWLFLALAAVLVAVTLFSAVQWQVYGDELRALAAQHAVEAETLPSVHKVEIISYGFGIPFASAVGLILGFLGTYLMMEWKNLAAYRVNRFLLVGIVWLVYALFLLVGGLSGSWIESFLPFHNLVTIFIARLINPAFWGPLAVGVVSLRRWAALRKGRLA